MFPKMGDERITNVVYKLRLRSTKYMGLTVFECIFDMIYQYNRKYNNFEILKYRRFEKNINHDLSKYVTLCVTYYVTES